MQHILQPDTEILRKVRCELVRTAVCCLCHNMQRPVDDFLQFPDKHVFLLAYLQKVNVECTDEKCIAMHCDG